MFDSIVNVNDFLSEHWLTEVFPNRLKESVKRWKDEHEHGKATPLRGLAGIASSYLTALAELPGPKQDGYEPAVEQLHRMLLGAIGIEPALQQLDTEQAETPLTVPLLARIQGPTGEALHVLQAAPLDAVDDLFADEAALLTPIVVRTGAEKAELLHSIPKAITQLFISDASPRYLLVVAGSWVVLTDAGRWAEGRYLAFDVRTALDRRDDKVSGELAWHAGLYSADVLLPGDDGKSELDAFTEDSVKHAIGVSEDLREGLRTSIELIAGEVIAQRRKRDEQVEGIDELPGELTSQSLRFLYRILFLLYAEARPELGVLPVGTPEYAEGYGLDRLRELIQIPLTGAARGGHHLHDSLAVLFRLVNDGHDTRPRKQFAEGTSGEDGWVSGAEDGLVFEALRADLFDPGRTPHIDNVRLSNAVLQEVLQLLLLSKPSKRKRSQRGYVSYANLGINQLGAVYEGLMSYSGVIADQDMVEVAKDGSADKGCWLVPADRAGDYDEKDLVQREDRITGEKRIVRHPKGTFVFRLSGRDRQRSASYYTPEVLTRTVVKHALAELITETTTAADILEYRICEPALGSGAFLNEALNQLAKAYLDRRQDELGERIDPDKYAVEEQKVKAYLALHRAYGVDLNATGVELAEVSLWLNVMHPGLQAPWFGLHLRRGNSLIGARRAAYELAELGRAKQAWYSTPPTDRPLADGSIGEGEIHHFLLPADGWGAVGNAKQAKELAPDQASALRAWQRQMKRKPGKKDVDRLQSLARRVERLWELTLRRLEISEREISRDIDVWRADLLAHHSTVTRKQVEDALNDPASPYQRLRWVMDAWCALWFWPLDGVAPPAFAEWLNGLEAILGLDVRKADKRAGEDKLGLYSGSESFERLAEADQTESALYQMRDPLRILSDYPWLGVVRQIAKTEGFFHWELDFAQIFNRGGFDLQVGNPPWVRPVWRDDIILSESDPYFSLQKKIPEATFNRRRAALLEEPHVRANYLDDLASWSGTAAHLGSAPMHPVLTGVQTNLYLNFMERVWGSANRRAVIGLLHPEGHLTDPKAGALRRATYERLRGYANFIEANRWFDGVDSPTQTFGIHIYGGKAREPKFWMITNLQDIQTLEDSFAHDGTGEVPGSSYPSGERDTRPHLSRVVEVSIDTLVKWAKLFDPSGTSPFESRLVRPMSREHLEILSILSSQAIRMSNSGYLVSTGWHEKGAKKDGTIRWETSVPRSWSDVVLQGPHIAVAAPLAKQPNEHCRSKNDYSSWDLENIPDRVVPRTNYQRACSQDLYDKRLDEWAGSSMTSYWRLAWRQMVDLATERSLQPALIPPGPTHINAISSLATLIPGIPSSLDSASQDSNQVTALIAGLWASLPYDYLARVSGKANINSDLIDRFPAPVSHPAASYLLLRILRLNCLILDYASLWNALFEPCYTTDTWTSAFAGWTPLEDVGPKWTMDTPLRTEFERRAALVEIDALAAIMLGLTADQLALMYRAQFPVLRKYEYAMFFDSLGHKIAKDHQTHGVNQQKDDYKLLMAYFDGDDYGDLLERYELDESTLDGPYKGFIKVDREAEMRAAYADFERRLGQ